jgi:hypothetical protein
MLLPPARITWPLYIFLKTPQRFTDKHFVSLCAAHCHLSVLSPPCRSLPSAPRRAAPSVHGGVDVAAGLRPSMAAAHLPTLRPAARPSMAASTAGISRTCAAVATVAGNNSSNFRLFLSCDISLPVTFRVLQAPIPPPAQGRPFAPSSSPQIISFIRS